MTVAYPLLLWFVPALSLLLLAAWRVRLRRARRLQAYLTEHPGPEFWPVTHHVPLSWQKWRIRGGLLVLAGLCLGLVLAGPQAGNRTIPVAYPGQPLILVLDLSRSMEVTDVPLGRLNSARVVARRVLGEVGELPVGLVVFAGEAHGILPPSSDRDLLWAYLAAASPGMLTHQGTSLLAGLEAARELAGEENAGAGILLLSDGEGHDGDGGALHVAREIGEAGGWVSVVSLGTETGGSVPASSPFPSGLRIERADAETGDGRPHSRARPAFLSEMAEAGSGVFAQGADPSQVADLGRWMGVWAADQERGLKIVEVPREVWSWFLVLAVAGLLLETFLDTSMSRKRVEEWS